MILNYSFQDPALLQVALTHSSVSKDGETPTYERLEFLGDNVINLMISERLFNKFPHFSEGKLSQIHSNLVKTETLAVIALKLNLNEHLKLDIGEEKNNGRSNKNILEDVFEALAGAIFLDSNYENAKTILLPLWDDYINNEVFLFARDPKSLLQEWAQKQGLPIPMYNVIEEEGPSHKRVFTVALNIPGFKVLTASHNSIKAANVAVATKFLEDLKNER